MANGVSGLAYLSDGDATPMVLLCADWYLHSGCIFASNAAGRWWHDRPTSEEASGRADRCVARAFYWISGSSFAIWVLGDRNSQAVISILELLRSCVRDGMSYGGLRRSIGRSLPSPSLLKTVNGVALTGPSTTGTEQLIRPLWRVYSQTIP